MAKDMARVVDGFVDEFGRMPSDVLLCGSLKNEPKWEKVAVQLEDAGLTVMRPHHIEHQPWNELPDDIVAKGKSLFVREHLAFLAEARALLICNYTKDDQKHHIGAHALLQMTAAYVWGIPIFILNNIPDTPNREEVLALQPRVLGGDLDKLIHYLKQGEQ